MQSGIAYAAGQLLAVVAPKTVLVVDAPTDWSLAGPLWELALDDAPVDEILDVLVRRGIRTAPSFAIVRVENDAVRALVRGGVPVCFERVGEPVRLDATGATTWLEGLISGARRVLVGAVETGTSLPYHVSTGVVLVSGLALPCGDQSAIEGAEAAPAPAQEEPAPALEEPVLTPGTPVGAGAGRVVDLTRSASRTPARSFSTPEPRESRDESWALASARSGAERPSGFAPASGGGLNGHAPAVLEPLPSLEPAPEPSSLFEPASADDPGELLDVESPAGQGSALDAPAAPSGTEPDPYLEPSSWSRSTGPGDVDDLLSTPDEDGPRGPSPADLPNLDPPAVSLHLNGSEAPAAPRGFGGAPAAWPPAPDTPDQYEGAGASGADRPRSYWDEPSAPPAESSDRFAVAPVAPAAPEETEADPADAQALGDLPVRVRGRSLRPEQAAGTLRPVEDLPSDPNAGNPANGARLLGEPEPAAAPPPFNSAEAHQAGASGSLLLPAFFRGARAARQPGDEVDSLDALAGAPTEVEPESPAGSPWPPAPASPPGGAWSQAPAPSARRGFPDRSSGFNGGPPAMPGVLRPGPPDEGRPESRYDDLAEEPTEVTQGPAGGSDADREPPRLLGVWCDAGHVTSPDREECRVCGLPVPPQAPILVARPSLGVLIFDNGDRVEVDRPIVLGRDPKPGSGADDEAPRLHPVTSSTGQVSRTHAEVRPSGWDVVLTDLGAMNGTALTLPGANPVAVDSNSPTLIVPGSRVDLGGETGFVFEVEG